MIYLKHMLYLIVCSGRQPKNPEVAQTSSTELSQLSDLTEKSTFYPQKKEK